MVHSGSCDALLEARFSLLSLGLPALSILEVPTSDFHQETPWTISGDWPVLQCFVAASLGVVNDRVVIDELYQSIQFYNNEDNLTVNKHTLWWEKIVIV